MTAVERVTALRERLAEVADRAAMNIRYLKEQGFSPENFCGLTNEDVLALVAHAEGILDRHDDCTPGQCCYCTDERGRFLPWPCPEVVALCKAWTVKS